ncbi:helix-turn-helix domain-containing protein [Pollutibacter soli]|uniref:helix-turn-helix domain-containing protein n=1 Tax=Pollutibacter soli TaxID=3034157 RepID=UPI0030134C5F
MQQILFLGLSPVDFLSRIEEVIDARLKVLPSHAANSPGYLSRTEVAEILKISLPTLAEWTKQGLLKSYKIGNRVLYKLDEVETQVQSLANNKFKKTKI